MVQLRTAGYAQSLAIAAGPVVPATAAIVTFLAYIGAGNALEPAEVSLHQYRKRCFLNPPIIVANSETDHIRGWINSVEFGENPKSRLFNAIFSDMELARLRPAVQLDLVETNQMVQARA